MKSIQILLLLIIVLQSCKNSNTTKTILDTTSTQIIFKQESISSIELLSENGSDVYKTVESNFDDVSIQLEKFDMKAYFAHTVTTTQKRMGVEGQERNIQINISAFNKPDKALISINKNCDRIDLQNHTYRTVKYGCCLNPNKYGVFDYQNRPIIEECEGKLATGFIPNSRLIIYAGIKKELKDSSIIGTLYFATTNHSLYAIKIKHKAANPTQCEDCVPTITFIEKGKETKFDEQENEYTLWSLDQLEDEQKINNLTIQLSFYQSETQKPKTLQIPIVNGKPFGKENSLQEIWLD